MHTMFDHTCPHTNNTNINTHTHTHTHTHTLVSFFSVATELKLPFEEIQIGFRQSNPSLSSESEK